MIRQIEEKDIEACLGIYNYYIRNTTATLELDELPFSEFAGRVQEIGSSCPYLVFEDNTSGRILGYAYIHAFSPRGGYRTTAEFTVYADKDAKERGVGRALFEAILEKAEALGYRDIISVVTGENKASLAFHKRMGFTVAGELRDAAEKFGRRFSVFYLQYRI